MRIVLFHAALAFYAIFAPDYFINGDAEVYAHYAANGIFTQVTTHLGYYVIAYPFAQLPFPLATTLNLLNCAFGAGIVTLVGLLAEALFKSRDIGLLASLFAIPNWLLVQNSVHAEIYAPQTFFVLLAAYLWQRRMAVLPGISAAMAFLISPSSAIAAPYFLVMRPRLRPLVIMAVVASSIATAALLPVLDDYLYSDRGVLKAASVHIGPKLALMKTGRDLFFGFFALAPFLVAGVIVCWYRFRRFLIATAVLWVAVFLLGERFTDVPVQLPTYMLLTVIAALGITRISRFAAVACLLVVPAVLIAAPFAPKKFLHYLPSFWELAIYVFAVFTVAILPRRRESLMAALACNLLLSAKDAPTARRVDLDNRSVISHESNVEKSVINY